MASYTPGELTDLVVKLLQEVAPEVDPLQIKSDAPLRDQVDIDSMDFLKWIGLIYENLGVDIPEADYSLLKSLDDLVAYLGARLQEINFNPR